MEQNKPPQHPKVNKVAAALSTLFAILLIPATAATLLFVQFSIGGCCGHTPTPGESERVALASSGVVVAGVVTFISSLYFGWKKR